MAQRIRQAGLVLLTGAALLGSPCGAAEGGQDFATWLTELRQEAREAGIDAAVLDVALADLHPIPRVIELDRSQPEFTWTFEQYLERVVSDKRVAEGRRRLADNRELLEQVRAAYGVAPEVLVALWGIETHYGQISGGFGVIPALATLAHDGRRSAYFRGELLHALHILDEGHIAPAAMMGSWAGAMGQPQFMPSSFRNFAVDFDADGRKDIWQTRADVFASAANYLARSGWIEGQRWGRAVRLPADFDSDLIGLETRRHLSQWQQIGVRRADGRDLPKRPDLLASVVQPDGPGGRAFVVYDNYRTILKWNRSHYFALAVGILSQRIAGGS